MCPKFIYKYKNLKNFIVHCYTRYANAINTNKNIVFSIIQYIYIPYIWQRMNEWMKSFRGGIGARTSRFYRGLQQQQQQQNCIRLYNDCNISHGKSFMSKNENHK